MSDKWIGGIDEWMQRALTAEAEVEQTRAMIEALTEGIRNLTRERDEAERCFRQGRNWLRRNANAEINPDKRAAFIEAHNAMMAQSHE